MGHVFISYAREDRQKAVALATVLEAAGISTWLDDQLVAGSHFDTAIEIALAEATCVVVAWSPAAAASRWVRAEAGDGLERGILVPVLVEPTQLPLEFRRIQAVDLTEWPGNHDDENLLLLLAALKPHIGASAEVRESHSPSTHREIRRRPTGRELSAELVHASRSGTLKIIVRSGSDSVVIHHITRSGLAQEVLVNYKPVSKSEFGSFREHHKFSIKLDGQKRIVELTLYGMLIFGISEFSLRIDGQEILRRGLGWVGYALAVLAAFSLGMFLSYTSSFSPFGIKEQIVDGAIFALLFLALAFVVLWSWIRHGRRQ